jgi:hypothetical protein
VRNKRNIERVRRDEEIAKQNELSKEKRILLAEQERRTQLLRDKAQTSSQTVTTTVIEGSLPSKHINIFDDFKDKITTENIEHQKEVKEEKEKWEITNGLLNYLHKKDVDSDNNWYLDSHDVRMKLVDDKNDHKINNDLKDVKVKKFNDPLEDMKRYLDVMKHKTSDNSNKSNKKCIQFVKSNDSKKDKKSVKHKHKKKKRKRRHSSSSSEDSDNTSNTSNKSVSKSLEQLRAERLNREKVERERTRLLLSSKMKTNEELVIMDDRQRSYNSQFNPQIARQNIDK